MKVSCVIWFKISSALLKTDDDVLSLYIQYLLEYTSNSSNAPFSEIQNEYANLPRNYTDTGTSIKSGGVKLNVMYPRLLYVNSCRCFPQVSKLLPTVAYNWMSIACYKECSNLEINT